MPASTPASEQAALLASVEAVITLAVQILAAKNLTIAEKQAKIEEQKSKLDEQKGLIDTLTSSDVLIVDNNTRLQTAIAKLSDAITPAP